MQMIRVVWRFLLYVAATAIAIPTLAILAYISLVLHNDRCTEQPSEKSKSIASKIYAGYSKNRYFIVNEASDKTPIFYCILAHKTVHDFVKRFADTLNYKLPKIQYCGMFSFRGRLLLFFEDEMIDVSIPQALVHGGDDGIDHCFSDSSAIMR